MKILHILSQVVVTGAEVYAAALADEQLRHGHQAWILSDTFRTPTQAPHITAPIADRSYLQRGLNIALIRKLVRQHGIEVVHAHSRAASWVAYLALKGLKIPLISTIHGRQHLHLSTKLYDIYGRRVIAVCPNLEHHLRHEVHIQPHKITMIPNGFDFDELAVRTQPPAGPPVLSIIGRTNGGKGERTAELLVHVLPVVLEKIKDLKVRIIGGTLDTLPASGREAFRALAARFEGRVEAIGFVQDLPRWIAESSLVIASGRVAIEALAMNVPLWALGESLCHGLVTTETLHTCISSNFGDISATASIPPFDHQGLSADLCHALQQARPPEMVAHIRAYYGLSRVYQQVMHHYAAARMEQHHPAHIPVLMYHKIPDQPLSGRHQTFVTKDNFARHLAFFQKQKLTPITFAQYLEYGTGKRPLKQFPANPVILTFDDGYLDNYTNLLPLMQQAGWPGVLYLLGDTTIDHNCWDVAEGERRDELMSPEQRKAFVAAGWEIGAHSMTHRHLDRLPEHEVLHEIQESKRRLEADLGIEVVSFAYPYGSYDEKTKAAARQAGFAFGIATDTGGMHLEEDRFAIFRVNIFPHDDENSLWKKTSAWYRRYYRWKRGK